MDGIIERLLGFLDTGKPFVTAEAVIQARERTLLLQPKSHGLHACSAYIGLLGSA